MMMLIERLESQYITRCLDLKAAVDAGQVLDDYDRSFLTRVIKDAMQNKRLIDQYPEYQPIYARVIHLYKSIADQALMNEMNQGRGSSASMPQFESLSASQPHEGTIPQ